MPQRFEEHLEGGSQLEISSSCQDLRRICCVFGRHLGTPRRIWGLFWGAHLANLQSEAMCPAPPHLVHTVVLVMLRVSVLCHGLRILSGPRGLFRDSKGNNFNLIKGVGPP